MINYPDHSRAWVNQLETLTSAGDLVSPRGMESFEIRWSAFSVSDPSTFMIDAQGRSFRHVIGVLEGLSLVGQVNIPETFTDRVAKFEDFMDGGVLYGAYGARIHGRLGDLVDLLRRDPDSRQAVLTIFDSRSDLGATKKDIPCTIAVHFMVRNNRLEMKVMMRSNDIWLGTPYDLMQFSILQLSVAQALGIKPGRYVHAADSLHLYRRDLEKADLITGLGHGRSFGNRLWGTGDDNTIDAISTRARRLLLGQVTPETEFEAWANRMLL